MRFAAVVVALLALCVSADASIIYTTGGAPDSGNFSRRLTGIQDDFDNAMAFTTPDSASVLGSVKVILWHSTGSPTVDVKVAADNAGKPGTVLEQVTVTAPDEAAIVTAGFSGSITLSPNTQYWLWLSTPAADSENFWKDSAGTTGTRATSRDNGATWSLFTASTLSAFEVNTTIVPEPGSLWLMGLATIALLRRFRRA